MALQRNYQDVVKILKENGAIDVGGIYDADNREHSSEDGAEPMTGKRSAEELNYYDETFEEQATSVDASQGKRKRSR